jgi:hypothetical protein
LFNIETILTGLFVGGVCVIPWIFVVLVNGQFRKHQAVNLLRGRGFWTALGEGAAMGCPIGFALMALVNSGTNVDAVTAGHMFWGGVGLGVGIMVHNYWRCAGLTFDELYVVAKIEDLDQEVYERNRPTSASPEE